MPILVDEVHSAISTADSDGVLEQLHEQLTEAWHRREVDRPIAETLAQQMWDRSRLLESNVQGGIA